MGVSSPSLELDAIFSGPNTRRRRTTLETERAEDPVPTADRRELDDD